MFIFRRFKKTGSLRIVNILGLSVVFVSLLLSFAYIKREFSFDRYNANANRMVRMSLRYGGNPVDGRIWGNKIDAVLQQMPEIEQSVKMRKVNTAVLTYKDESQSVNDFYYASPNFFDVFSIPLIAGEKGKVLESANQVVISRSLAHRLFGDDAVGNFNQSEGILINGRQVGENSPFYVSGIFEDIPETSHFHTDIILKWPDTQEGYLYHYLLLKEKTNLKALEQKMTQLAQAELHNASIDETPYIMLMPITDIHLHSRMLREMGINGNINYIYLVIGANLLLLTVVLFNLWLNQILILSAERKYYQLLRINGASSFSVLKDEALLALLTGSISFMFGILIARSVTDSGYFHWFISPAEIVWLSLGFLIVIISISLIPVIKNISYTLFDNTRIDLKPVKFSYANIKYLLTAQYALVMISVILAFGIGKQMNMVKSSQTGGDNPYILILKEQSDTAQERYDLLKMELLKHPEIESVTATFELPGDAIRDYITVIPEGREEKAQLPFLITDKDFLSFFDIGIIAGRDFSPKHSDYKTEERQLLGRLYNNQFTDLSEEYIINRKALAVLGFSSAEEAIGKTLKLEHGMVDYINKGVICGVTDDFNYTGLHQASIPLLIMKRQWGLHHIMVHLNPGKYREALTVFENVWKEMNPEDPADYTFMKDKFGKTYANELNAEKIVYLFSFLCFLIADLGLIIFISFLIKRKTKEIAIRKVSGASIGDIIGMLNMNYIRLILIAFAVSVPIAWYVMYRWLQNFAYQTTLDWWIFALAGLTVLTLSIISVSVQSGRAATANPVDALTSE